jgi:hypothetical protein
MDWSRNKWLVAGIGCIALGYVLLAALESVTMAPILLVAGYCVLIPLHLWSRYRGGVGE